MIILDTEDLWFDFISDWCLKVWARPEQQEICVQQEINGDQSGRTTRLTAAGDWIWVTPPCSSAPPRSRDLHRPRPPVIWAGAPLTHQRKQSDLPASTTKQLRFHSAGFSSSQMLPAVGQSKTSNNQRLNMKSGKLKGGFITCVQRFSTPRHLSWSSTALPQGGFLMSSSVSG